MLIRFAEKYVSRLYAEDMVQDVFLKFWDKKISFLSETDLKRMLYTAVRNACIDHLRRLSSEQETIDRRAIKLKMDELDFFEPPDEPFMREDLMAFLVKRIDKLPERSRTVFHMFYFDELKTSEIADQLHLSVRTVENLLYRSLLYLRKHIPRQLLFLFLFV
jgi:RNA polymerase sigma-70 factor (ECF subfamily)